MNGYDCQIKIKIKNYSGLWSWLFSYNRMVETLGWIVFVLAALWAIFCLSRFYSWNQVTSRPYTEISYNIENILYATGMKRKFQINFYGLLIGLGLVLAFPHISKLWLVPLSILLIIIGGRIQIKTIDECWKVDVDRP